MLGWDEVEDVYGKMGCCDGCVEFPDVSEEVYDTEVDLLKSDDGYHGH